MDPVSVTHARLIEKWATDILRRYARVTGHPLSLPIPIIDIAERLFALRCDVENLKGTLANASGVLIPRGRWIVVNRQQNSNRMRFTLAHELAHWLIECQDLQQGDHGLEYITGLRSDNNYVREKRADYVAGALLMPKQILLDKTCRLGAIDEERISELAVTFGVSRLAVQVRLDKLRHDVDNLGIRWSPSYDKHHKVTHRQYGPRNRDVRNLKAAVAKVSFSVVDHSLYRKLLSLKRECAYLYIALSSRDGYEADVLCNLDCVDGFALLEDELFRDLERYDLIDSNEDISYCTIDNGRWLKGLVQDDLSSLARGDGIYVVTPRSDGSTELVQRALLDISRFISPPFELNYRQDAKLFVRQAKESGKRVVIVTGCFDLLTSFHVRFLKRAKAAGDVLVVGIEDDTRVRAFKGLLRPVNAISQRVEVIDALEFVDFTFVISGSPKMPLKPFYTRLHKTISADILAVTEGDPYLEDRRDEIEATGGKLVVVSRYEDVSSTSLIRRFLSEIEYSDMLLVSKQSLQDYVAEHQTNWRQLRLPFDSSG